MRFEQNNDVTNIASVVNECKHYFLNNLLAIAFDEIPIMYFPKQVPVLIS